MVQEGVVEGGGGWAGGISSPRRCPSEEPLCCWGSLLMGQHWKKTGYIVCHKNKMKIQRKGRNYINR